MERKWKRLSNALSVIVGGFINRIKLAENAMFDIVYLYHTEFPRDEIFRTLNPKDPTYRFMFSFTRDEEDETTKEELYAIFECMRSRDPQYFALTCERVNGKLSHYWKWNHGRENTFIFDQFVFDWGNILKEKYENPDCREKIDRILAKYDETKKKIVSELKMYVRDARSCCAKQM